MFGLIVPSRVNLFRTGNELIYPTTGFLAGFLLCTDPVATINELSLTSLRVEYLWVGLRIGLHLFWLKETQLCGPLGLV